MKPWCGVIGVAVVAVFHTAGAEPVCLNGLDGATLQITGNTTTVCNGSLEDPKCWSLALGRAPVAVDPPPAPPITTAAELRKTNSGFRVCVGSTCKRPGNRLAARLRKSVRDDSMNESQTFLRGTTDFKAVVVGTELWSVPEDRKLQLAPPREYAARHEARPTLVRIEVIDELLVPAWSNCAGPCTRAVIASSSGKNLGAWFPAGTPIALADGRFVVSPRAADGEFTLFERHTGKFLDSLTFIFNAVAETEIAAAPWGNKLIALVPGDGLGDSEGDNGHATVTVFSFPKDGHPYKSHGLFTLATTCP